jgi:hypothetical protein
VIPAELNLGNWRAVAEVMRSPEGRASILRLYRSMKRSRQTPILMEYLIDSALNSPFVGSR